MDANDRSSHPAVCDCDQHRGRPFTIVLLQIDDETPAEAMANIEAALRRAARQIVAQNTGN